MIRSVHFYGMIVLAASGAATAQSVPLKTVSALGRLEPGQGVLELTGPPGERIAKLNVTVGQVVKAGVELAAFESHAVRLAEWELAKARLADAKSALDAELAHAHKLLEEAAVLTAKAEKMRSLNIATQVAEVAAAGQFLNEAQNRLIDLQDLGKREPKPFDIETRISQQQDFVKRYETNHRVARALLNRVEEETQFAIDEARARHETGKQAVEKVKASAQINSLEKAVELARTNADRAVLKAPTDGQVLKIHVWAGQSIANRPVMQFGDTEKMYVVAEVYETDLRRIRVGQKAEATSPALDKPLLGEVEEIGRLIQKNDVLGIDPLATRDARVIEVRIRLENSAAAAGWSRLQVDVKIRVESNAP